MTQADENIEDMLLIDELSDKLSNMQKTILKKLFFIGCTQTDLAKKTIYHVKLLIKTI